MITLFGFGPAFDLPDPSPFVMKTEVQLKMSGLDYKRELGGPQGAPKGKIPYIDDDGVVVADSTFIRAHLERAHGFDLDRGLSAEQKAQAWAVERMLEDHLYWSLLHARWMDDANFAKGPAHFFDGAPQGAREAARERTRNNLFGHGLGRHSESEILFLGSRTLDSLAGMLGQKPYLMGDQPCGADATMFAMVAGVLTPFFATALRDAALSRDNLVRYSERMMRRYYPEFSLKVA